MGRFAFERENYMKFIKLIGVFLAAFIPLISFSDSAYSMKLHPEVAEDVRVVAAKEALSNRPNSVILYVKGLCCPSCAIGIRKKITQLDFVDKTRFNNGVDLDAKYQLTTVAIIDGKKPDYELLSIAVSKAGYEAVRYYELKGGSLITKPLEIIERK